MSKTPFFRFCVLLARSLYAFRERIDFKVGGGRVVTAIFLGAVFVGGARATDLPEGGVVRAGAGEISQLGSDTLQVDQHSGALEVDWQSFSVGEGNAVNFIQPSAGSVAVNRVLGSDVSSIQGSINANGQVFLVNPNGVVFSTTAQVNVGGLVASTRDLSSGDFDTGNFVFEGSGAGEIVNAGSIAAADGGYVAMIAARIENMGTIVAEGGDVSLGAGDLVSLDIGGPVRMRVERGRVDAYLSNGGAIDVGGGSILLSARAAGDLSSSVINQTGRLSATSLVERGGRILLEGDSISLGAESETLATGATGGGKILIGGDWQGSGELEQAVVVAMEEGARADASATEFGDGGDIVLWSDVTRADSVTTARGDLFARGGAFGGDGGRVETSGNLVNLNGILVDAGAASGEGGLWLIDPYDYTIDGTAAGNIVTTLNTGTDVTVTTTADVSGHGSSGNAGDSGDITVSSDIVTGAMSGDATLTLKAHQDISINEGVTIDATQNSNTARLNVVIWADQDASSGGSVSLGGANSDSSIKTNGGGLWIGGGSGTTSWTPFAGGSSISVGDGRARSTSSTAHWSGIEAFRSELTTAGGHIYMAGEGSRNTDTSDITIGIHLEDVQVSADAGSITLDGTVTNEGTIEVDKAVGMHVVNGTTLSTSSGDISIVGSTDANSRFSYGGGLLFGKNIDGTVSTDGVSITSTSGDITLVGTVDHTVDPAWGHGLLAVIDDPGLDISTTTGDISLTGSVTPGATGESIGLLIQHDTAGASTDITTDGGSISLSGDSDEAGGNFGLTLRPNETAGNIVIGDANTGDVTLRADTLDTKDNTATGTIKIAGAGDLVISSNAASFASDVSLPDEYDFSSTFQDVTLGETTNAQHLAVETDLTFGGNFSAYGGSIEVTGDLTHNSATDSQLLLKAQDFVKMNAALQASGDGKLDTLFWSKSDGDASDNSGNNFVKIGYDSPVDFDTNGGHIWVGGSASDGGSTAWNGLTVGDGATKGASGIDLVGNFDTRGGGNGDGAIYLHGGTDSGAPYRGVNLAYSDDLWVNAESFTVLSEDQLGLGNIVNISTTGGDVLFSSDSDSSGTGAIVSSATVSFTTSGGDITFGGGLDGSGFAEGNETGSYQEAGIRFTGTVNLDSGGGDIAVRGRSGTTSNDGDAAWGVSFDNDTTMDSGTGTIYIHGVGRNTTAGALSEGVTFSHWNTETTDAVSITSANTTDDAIKIIGDASAATATGTSNARGLTFWSTNTSITATGEGGGITLEGHRSGSDGYAVWLKDSEVLANGGALSITGKPSDADAEGQVYLSGVTLGKKAATTVTASASDISVIGDSFSSDAFTIDTTGDVSLMPLSAVFPSDTIIDTTILSAGDVSIGKVGETEQVTLRGAKTFSGDFTAYGGTQLMVEAGTLTSTDTGDFFLQSNGTSNPALVVDSNVLKTGGDRSTFTMKSAGRTRMNGTITASNPGGMNVILWSDFDGGNEGGAGFSGNISTGGGHFWMGGSDEATTGSSTWNGLTVGDGGSVGANGYNYNAMDFYASVSTGGGDVLVWGGDGYSGGVSGIGIGNGTQTIDADGGDVTLIGDDFEGELIVDTTGHLAIRPNGDAFEMGTVANYDGTLSSDTFTGTNEDIDWLEISNYSSLGGLTLGKEGMDTSIQIHDSIAISGPINLLGKDIDVDSTLDTSGVSGGEILLKATGEIDVAASQSLTTDDGGITLWSDSDNDGAGGILLGDSVAINTADGSTVQQADGGDIVIGGGADGDSNGVPDGYASSTTGHAISLGASGSNASSLYSGGGDISIRGKTTVTGSDDYSGVVSWGQLTVDTGEGSLTIEGESADSYGVLFSRGLGAGTSLSLSSAATSGTAISVSGVSTADHGLFFDQATDKVVQATGGGSIQLDGTSPLAAKGIRTQQLDVLASSGAITLRSQTGGLQLSSTTLGQKAGTDVTSSTGNITLTGDTLVAASSSAVATTGTLTVEPDGTSFTSALSWPVSDFSVSSISGLTLGKTGSTSEITIDSAQSVAGDIDIFGGNISINAPLTSTGSNTVSITSGGTVSDGASGYITTAKLAFLGTGDFVLNHASNDADTIASSTTGDVSYVDADALVIGEVNPTGISTDDTISISTVTGNLTVSEDIATTDTSASALILNAGSGTAAGTSTGGNIVFSNDATVAVGSGGRATLYSGSVSGSTGLTAAVGSGSGRFRYNSDESTTNFTKALGGGINGVYRERPTLTIATGSETVTYGTAPATTVTVTGVNGDTATHAFSTAPTVNVGGSTSTSGNYIVGTHALTNTGAVDQIGYALSLTGGVLTVEAKALTVSGLSVADRVYDGTTVATVVESGAVFGGLESGDVVTISGTSGAFADKNVGEDKAIALSSSTYGGADKGNYTITDQAATTADITAMAMTVSGIIAANKVYDGGASATLDGSGVVLGGLVSGDDLSLNSTGGVFSDKNVAEDKTVTLTNAFAGDDKDNYAITDQANTTADITKKALAVSGIAAADKIYDGGVSATVDGSAVAFSGLVSGDDLSLDSSSGVFSDKNVDEDKTVTLTNAYAGTDKNNYTITDQASATADITAKVLTVSGITASDKVYDGNATATVDGSEVAFSGLVSGDDLSLDSSSGAFSDKNVDEDKTVTLTNAYAGADKNNYTITDQASATADITAKALTVSGIAASDKVYDGNVTATVDGSEVAFSGLVSGDDLSLDSSSGVFSDKNVGEDKTVTLTNAYTGDDKNNYTIADQVSATADITAKALTVSGITASDKVYDGNATAMVDGSEVAFSGLVSGDDLSLDSTSGVFADKNAAEDKTVTLTNAYAGDDKNNYTIADQVSATADITAKALTVSGITASDKIYDGNATAMVDGSEVAFSGLVSGDDLSLDSTSGAFSDKNVDEDKTVTLTNAYTGDDKNNYTIADQVSATADIAARALTVYGITASDKVYDGATGSTVSVVGASFAGLVAGDDISVIASGSFSDRNVGVDKLVSLSSSYSGADVGNYSITGQGGATADITAKGLTVSGITAEDKVYDATTEATVSASEVVFGGLVAGDEVSISVDGVFADKNVAEDKAVALTSIYSGADLANYSVTDQATALADITAKALRVSGIAAADKIYDGGVAAEVSAESVAFEGLVSGDELSIGVTGVFEDKNAGEGKTVLLTSDYSGADVLNYRIQDQATAEASVSPKALEVSGLLAEDKVYDGNTAAAIDVADAVLAGMVSGDELSVSASGVFADKNVGEAKTVTIEGMYSGADVGNYRISTQGSSEADITRRDKSRWVGGDTGDWFDPGNWEGGAIPDLANVSNVEIPNGSKPVFDGGSTDPAAAPVQLDTVSGGDLEIVDGALDASKSIAVEHYTQSGGTVTGDAELTASESFGQTGGSVDVTGDVDITNKEGDLEFVSIKGDSVRMESAAGGIALGDLTAAGDLELNAGGGTISQTETSKLRVDGRSSVEAKNGESPADIILGGADNDFQGNVDLDGGQVEINDAAGSLDLGTVLASSDVMATSEGELSVETMTAQGIRLGSAGGGVSLGDVAAGQNLDVTSGGGSVIQKTDTTILAGGESSIVARSGEDPADVILDGAANDFSGKVDLSGAEVTVRDSVGSLSLGTVAATGKVDAESEGDLSFGSIEGEGVSLVSMGGGIEAGDLAADGDLTLKTGGGAISQTEGSQIAVVGEATIESRDGTGPADISFDGAGNDFAGSVSLEGAKVKVSDSEGDLNLGTVVASGDLTVSGKGEVVFTDTTVGGNLESGSSGGSIVDKGNMSVAGLRKFEAESGAVPASSNEMKGMESAVSHSQATVQSMEPVTEPAAVEVEAALTEVSEESGEESSSGLKYVESSGRGGRKPTGSEGSSGLEVKVISTGIKVPILKDTDDLTLRQP